MLEGAWRTEQPLPETAAPRARRRGRTWAERARLTTAAVLFAALTVFVMQESVRGFEARGVSMEPTVHDGDTIFVNRLAYAQVDFGVLDWAPGIDPDARWASPSRGDVIVFHSPIGGSDLIKRVVGLPGEHVEIERGRVVVDGRQLIEPYVHEAETACRGTCAWDVPEGHYFVLGDNRRDSRDSREGWMVPEGSIVGEKLVSY
jgi:signal peptidase I